MTSILTTIKGLTAEHLELWTVAYLEDDRGDRRKVWDAKHMPPFVRPGEESPVTYAGIIRVAALEEDTITRAKTKIAAVDPKMGRRLVHK